MTKPKHSLILDTKTHFEHRFIRDVKTLDKLIKRFKKGGLKIVLTQGVWDLIHEGHAKYLEAAKSFGDILIVGLDSDELTRMRKGPNRPIVPEKERVQMLIHLRHVDIVTIRETHHDIGYLIRLVKPDVLVTSSSTSDFKDDLKAGTYDEFCKKIVTLPPQATTHTSARIRNLTIEGAEELAKEVDKLTRDFIKKIRST
ncbi:MAG: adenylyltransferase/cytidyltransferase family protein [Candidatus Colwellbacteria bacterium]|nr:adenylyltransferase/cytidyltransferase family protein [Candidatus Colwellbacteria bacterium]MBI3274088.1 adenylyltransferase/cytidyltransferase family protein [Candidatus Colwellbacteria bacterium]